MAIIKCPECGRQISDKAPTCPSCGVEIAGKITKCPNCGEIYFSNLEMCPNCHELNPSLTRMTPPTGMSQQTPASQASMTQQQEPENAAAIISAGLEKVKRSQTECNQTRRNSPPGGSQAAGSSSDTCQNSNTSYSTRSSGSPTAI